MIKKRISELDFALGRNLKVFRQKKGMTQKQLGKEVDLTCQQIQKYEKGINRIPASMLLRLCQALGIKPNHFLEDFLLQKKERTTSNIKIQKIVNNIPAEKEDVFYNLLKSLQTFIEDKQ